MNYVKEYYAAIKSGKEVVPETVRAVYKREVKWMTKPPKNFPFYFDEEEGERPIFFIETFCKHSKGEKARQNVELELFQKAKIQLIYGWKRKPTGYRRIRETVDIRGRKCGKSTETAAIELFSLIADDENGAEIYCTANKLDQAKIIFDEGANMRSQSEAIRAITKKRQSDIYFAATFSFMKALASDSKTMDGLNAHFFSQDEFHESKNRTVYDVMKQSQTARTQPLAWLISTNGTVREAFFDDVYEYAKKVAFWEPGYEDYELLPLIYQLDKREEWTDPKCWPKANPGLGKIKSFQALLENVEKAKRDPKFLPAVLTKDFNMPENSESTWLDYNTVLNTEVVDMEYLRKSYAVGGCDLSSTTDLTCATLVLRKPNDDNFYVLQKYFLPEARINNIDSKNIKEAPYKTWEKEGWLNINEGSTVDFHEVTAWFLHMVHEYNIRPLWVGYDRALSGYWKEEMLNEGFDMEKVAQGPYTWTYPMKQMEGIFKDGNFIYQNNPMLRWCLNNTAAKSLNKGGIESIQPVKKTSSLRIDGMVSLLNAMVAYYNHEEEYLGYVR